MLQNVKNCTIVIIKTVNKKNIFLIFRIDKKGGIILAGERTYTDIALDIESNELVQMILWKAIITRIKTVGYLQVDTYFFCDLDIYKSLYEKTLSKYDDFKSILSGMKGNQHKLKKEELEKMLIELKESDEDKKRDIITSFSVETCKDFIAWILCVYTKTVKPNIILTILENFKAPPLHEKKFDIKICNTYYIYDDKTVNLNFLEGRNLYGYLKIIYNLNPKGKLFYRGHNSLNYSIEPSVSRKPEFCKNEAKLYEELKLRCPDDFQKCQSHLDFLVEMQHYGLPTRLIDITTNPLVALYFAASGNEKCAGEVIIFDVKDDSNIMKYERSDTVSILSSLPLFSYEKQMELKKLIYSTDMEKKEFNKEELVRKLLHEIRIDKPAFTNDIEPEDICKNVFVMPSRRNDRIIKQSGAFIICGLSNINLVKEIYEILQKHRKGDLVKEIYEFLYEDINENFVKEIREFLKNKKNEQCLEEICVRLNIDRNKNAIEEICKILKENKNKFSLETMRYLEDNKRQIFVIENKSKIIKQISALDVNKASLFPEIDDVAEYLKTEWIKNESEICF